MRTADIYWVPGPWPGRLGIVPRPRGGDWLADEVRAWRASGLNVVVSLLTPDEAAELELQDEETRSREAGIELVSFPIPDYSVPRSRQDMAELVQRLEQALAAGKNVAVHCRQGIGRSSVLVASLLVAAGEAPDEAFRRIEEARGRPVPDTAEQREWVAGSQAGPSLRPPSHPAGEDAGAPRGEIGFDEGSVPGYNPSHNPSRR